MEAFLCLAYLCIYAYNYVPYTYSTHGPTIGVPQHDTKHTMDTSCGTPWNTSTTDVPRERSIRISRVAPPSFAGPRSCFFPPPATFFFLRLSSMFSLSSRYFSFRILPVIGFKVNRSKVIFSSRSLPLVPRERSVSCSFFYSSALLFFYVYYIFPLFLLIFLLFDGAASTNSEDDEKPGGKVPMEIGSRCIRPSAN